MKSKSESKIEALGYDPVAAILSGKETGANGGQDRSLYTDALGLILIEGTKRVQEMLHSNNQSVIAAALFIFSELPNRMAKLLFDDVVHLLHGVDDYLTKSNILDGIAPFSERLSPEMVSDILQWMKREDEVLCEKSVIMLKRVDTPTIQHAIDLIPDSTIRLEHQIAFKHLSGTVSYEQIGSLLQKTRSLSSYYAFVRLFQLVENERVIHKLPLQLEDESLRHLAKIYHRTTNKIRNQS